jgi:hypothetical protein
MTGPPPTRAPQQAAPTPWHQEPLVILVLAFTLLGPFAIPMVWQSPKFTKGVKIGLTAILLLLSILFLALAVVVAWIVVVHFQTLADAFQQLES